MALAASPISLAISPVSRLGSGYASGSAVAASKPATTYVGGAAISIGFRPAGESLPSSGASLATYISSTRTCVERRQKV